MTRQFPKYDSHATIICIKKSWTSRDTPVDLSRYTGWKSLIYSNVHERISIGFPKYPIVDVLSPA